MEVLVSDKGRRVESEAEFVKVGMWKHVVRTSRACTVFIVR
jgi:hypothetical protein